MKRGRVEREDDGATTIYFGDLKGLWAKEVD